MRTFYCCVAAADVTLAMRLYEADGAAGLADRATNARMMEVFTSMAMSG